MNDIVAALKKHNTLCGSFGLYQSFVAGVLNSVEKINFCAVCDERFDYANYIEKVLQIKKVVFLISRVQDANFRLSSESETIII